MSKRRVLGLAPIVLALLLATLACESTSPGLVGEPDLPPLDERGETLLARRALQDGRALRQEGRLDAAERTLHRGLALRPDDARLERELARVLEAAGRPDEAAAARARADRLDPPPPPLPDAPLAVGPGHTVVVIVPSTDALRPDDPPRWPDPAVEAAVARRVAVRAPEASLLRADPESVGEAAHVLEERDAARAVSLRVDRADCRSSLKDGEIAVAELRVAAAVRGHAARPATRAKVVLEDPPADDCAGAAVERAFEQALAGEAWRDAAARSPAPDAGWQVHARELFPGIGRRIARQLRHGESLLRAGELGLALRAFEDAARLDPGDAETRAYLDDTRQSLAMARSIAARTADGEPEAVDPRLSAAQRTAAEQALAREEERRHELLGALAILDEDVRAPSRATLDTLRPSEIARPDDFGPALARRRSGGPVEARAAFAPDGTRLARYYFAPGATSPVVREEDVRGDGRPDRWIAYRDGARDEIFEDRSGRGAPDLHLVFAPGGEPLERVSLDADGDGRPERVFRYADGRLRTEEADTNGDGRLDTFDRIGNDGRVDVREEDLDGDGAIDVKSVFRAGKLVRREITSPELVPES